MVRDIVWSEESLQDIEAIVEYISRDSIHYARRVAEAIYLLGESLKEQSERGRQVPELLEENIRERYVYSYRLIYEVKPQVVHILAVIHGKRLLTNEDRFRN